MNEFCVSVSGGIFLNCREVNVDATNFKLELSGINQIYGTSTVLNLLLETEVNVDIPNIKTITHNGNYIYRRRLNVWHDSTDELKRLTTKIQDKLDALKV